MVNNGIIQDANVDINIIYTFVNAGAKIIVIGGRIYVFDHWEAASPTMLKHKLIGKDVTQILSASTQFAHGNVDATSVQSEMMKFQNLPKVIMEIHPSIQFIMYARG